MNVFSLIYHFLFGYDFFISYSRSDGAIYAIALAKKLTDKGFTCYLDQWGSDPDRKLPRSLIRTLTGSKVMILLSTSGSRKSVHVSREIEEFRRTGRTIIPLSISWDHGDAIWDHLVAGVAITLLGDEELVTGSVNDKTVVERMTNSFTYTKQKTRIGRMAWGVAALVLLIPVTFGITYFIMSERVTTKNIELRTLSKQFQHDVDNFNRKMLDSSRLLSNVRTAILRSKARLDSTNHALREKEKSLASIDTEGKQLYEISAGVIRKIYKAYDQEKAYYQNNPISNPGDRFYTITFEFDSSVLHTRNYPTLDSVSSYLRETGAKAEVRSYASMFGLGVLTENPEIKISRWGPFDFQMATSAYLLRISQDRALGIARYLINSGVDKSNLMSKGYGDSRPKGTLGFFNDRVEIHILN